MDKANRASGRRSLEFKISGVSQACELVAPTLKRSVEIPFHAAVCIGRGSQSNTYGPRREPPRPHVLWEVADEVKLGY